LCRDGGNIRTYLNGVQQGAANIGFTSSLNVGGTAYSAAVGAWGNNSGNFTGYIDDFRFTKGYCRYPNGTTFTPPAAAFPIQ